MLEFGLTVLTERRIIEATYPYCCLSGAGTSTSTFLDMGNQKGLTAGTTITSSLPSSAKLYTGTS